MRTRPANQPTVLVAHSPGLDVEAARALATAATLYAKSIAPKSSGEGADSLAPVWGQGWYGISWQMPQMWFQEVGTRPFTMRALAGKVIPMWINDPTGEEARKIPAGQRADRTRVDAGGKRQVLIFRRAAPIGARRNVRGRSVPASYPGAPGRIALRQMAANALTSSGRIARTNVGVRWRHPGITGRGFMRHSLLQVAQAAGLGHPQITSRTHAPTTPAVRRS